jgi:hypothetical protein
MFIPSVKPTKFTFETEEILKHFSSELNSDYAKEHFPRLHKDNAFNKRFSGVLDTFADVKSVTERLTENIQASMKIEGQIQKQKDIDQELYKEASKLTAQNKTDLRTLYINSKIFLDHYTNLLRFIFNWRGIGDKSVTNFYNSLDKYNGSDESILTFKDQCIKKLKAVDVFITEYRDKKVVHSQSKHKETTEWFLNNMNGEIRFLGGGRPSITPQEILFIVVEYIDASSKCCIELLSTQVSSQIGTKTTI